MTGINTTIHNVVWGQISCTEQTNIMHIFKISNIFWGVLLCQTYCYYQEFKNPLMDNSWITETCLFGAHTGFWCSNCAYLVLARSSSEQSCPDMLVHSAGMEVLRQKPLKGQDQTQGQRFPAQRTGCYGLVKQIITEHQIWCVWIAQWHYIQTIFKNN